jgi:CHAT domain-containing protein
VGKYMANLAMLLQHMGEAPKALDLALRAESIARDNLRLTTRTLDEHAALAFASTRSGGLNVALTLAASGVDPPAAARVWEGLLLSRALVLDELADRHRNVARSVDPEVLRRTDSLRLSRQRLANLVYRGSEGTRPETFLALLNTARREARIAEERVAQVSVSFRREQASRQAGLAELVSALSPGDALLAYARYEQIHGNADGITALVPSYVGFVMKSGQSFPAVVQLGSGLEIDSLVALWRAGIQGGHASGSAASSDNTLRTIGEALRRRVWDPFRLHLAGAARVFIVPDGALHFVNLAALPVGQTGYLIEEGPLLHLLSAERDLFSNEQPEARAEGLLALGSPDFDVADQLAAAPAPGPLPFRGERSGCTEFASLRFGPLPATLGEVHEIAALWNQSSLGTRTTPGGLRPGPDTSQVLELTRAQASETAFKREARGRRVLHMATHGFFLGGDCLSSSAPRRGTGGLALATATEPLDVTSENPLLLSGLALAGANRREGAGAGEDDGILTAEEIAGLDLTGVEWAVLSACETGLGEIRTGEGVLGLRRAFQVAGVSTLILSLWSVEDQAARKWMRALYEARLSHGMGTAEAVRNASLQILRERRSNSESTHPFYWAAFVAAGDWR